MPSYNRPTDSDFIENYDALLHLPIVQNLMKKNKELRRKVKTLETLLYKFPELFEEKERKSKNSIKTESPIEPTLCDTLTDNDDVVFVPKLKDEEQLSEDEESEVIDLTGDDEEVLDVRPNVFIKIEPEIVNTLAPVLVNALAPVLVNADVEEEAEAEDAEEAEETEEAEDAEEAEETEEEEEAEEAEEEESEEPEKPSGDDEEVFEITIKGKSYYTNNETNGKIYSILEDEDVGPAVGQFVGGKAQFTKK